MDSIAFAFCDAVVGTIKKLPSVDVPFRDAKWNKALQDHSANRKCFTSCVSFSDGKWSYRLDNTEFGSNALLTSLVQQIGPKYLRFNYVEVTDGWANTKSSSKEELFVLIETLKPFLNFPRLSLYDLILEIPESDLKQFLSLFAKVNISAFYSCCNRRSAIEFAEKLMQQDTLVKRITIARERGLLSAAIAACRSTGTVVHVEPEVFPGYGTSLRFDR